MQRAESTSGASALGMLASLHVAEDDEFLSVEALYQQHRVK